MRSVRALASERKGAHACLRRAHAVLDASQPTATAGGVQARRPIDGRVEETHAENDADSEGLEVVDADVEDVQAIDADAVSEAVDGARDSTGTTAAEPMRIQADPAETTDGRASPWTPAPTPSTLAERSTSEPDTPEGDRAGEAGAVEEPASDPDRERRERRERHWFW